MKVMAFFGASILLCGLAYYIESLCSLAMLIKIWTMIGIFCIGGFCALRTAIKQASK
jgi:hypothetical protein